VKIAPSFGRDEIIIINLSGRGDKDVLSISKGIVFITPYAGIGGVFSQSEPVLPDWFPLTIEKESSASLLVTWV
jgi:hypothetical protein